VIKSTKGVEIKVDKVKEAKKEKVLKRGEVSQAMRWRTC